jgi:hypothetical protein
VPAGRAAAGAAALGGVGDATTSRAQLMPAGVLVAGGPGRGVGVGGGPPPAGVGSYSRAK